MKHVFLALLFAISFTSQAAPAPPVIQPILDATSLDKSVDPCDNFYQFSCGNWVKNFKLPSDKSSYWRQANVLTDYLEEQLNTLLAGLSKTKTASAYSNELSSFYKSCMNVKQAEKTGLPSLKKYLKRFDELGSRTETATKLGELHILGGEALFQFANNQDFKDSNQVIAFLDRGGISLPDRDYYLKEDAKSQEIRAAYKKHIAKVMILAGSSPQQGKATADFVLSFETDLAKNSYPLDDRRDMTKIFHPMSYSDLKTLVPAIDWDAYVRALGVSTSSLAKLNVMEPEFFKRLGEVLPKIKSQDLANYFKFKFIRKAAYYVGGPLQAEDFRFWHAYLDGQAKTPPRWKYCTQTVSNGMGEALGQAYINSIPNAQLIRAKTESMLTEIKTSFGEDLEKLSWMDSSTREGARKKLEKMGKKVGWPDHWRDYSKLKMTNDPFLENQLNSGIFETRRNLEKIGKPMDRSEWDMLVWEPNAYYSSSNNEMVLPLGELVPPVSDPNFSDGANYGSLGGGTIGHELTHGFDDSGKDMDADGNFVTWWSSNSKRRFEEKSACFIKQTESYDIIPGSSIRIRGKATLGENLADNGGVKLGLVALKRLMKTHPPIAKFEGYDEVQQYFLGYAQSWCLKMTDEKLRDQLLTDYHPPAEFRVNAVISNQPEFAQAFGCKTGSKMAPKERCSIW